MYKIELAVFRDADEQNVPTPRHIQTSNENKVKLGRILEFKAMAYTPAQLIVATVAMLKAGLGLEQE